jgi:hypothetical protein
VDDADVVKEVCDAFSGGPEQEWSSMALPNFDECGNFVLACSHCAKKKLALAVGFRVADPGDRICQHHAL